MSQEHTFWYVSILSVQYVLQVLIENSIFALY